MARKMYASLDLQGLELKNLRIENFSNEDLITSNLAWNNGLGEGRMLYDSLHHNMKYCGVNGAVKTFATTDDINGMVMGLEIGVKPPIPWQEEQKGLLTGTGYALTIKDEQLYLLVAQSDGTYKAYAFWTDQVWEHSDSYYNRDGMCIVIDENIYQYKGAKWVVKYSGLSKDILNRISTIDGRIDYLDNVSVRGIMEVWHTIIDYTKKFDVRATGSTVVARFAVNPYNPHPQHQFVIPSYKVTEGVDVKMTICSDAACTNVIADEGDKIEFAAGNFVYVKYELYYHTSVLGKKVEFAAHDAYGDYTGDTIATLSPVIMFCESDYVTPASGTIKVHTLNGGMLNAAGKKFGSDYRYLSKLSMTGATPSGGGDLSRVKVGKDFVINVNASADNTGDTIHIQVENAAVDVAVSTDKSPAYRELEYDIDAIDSRVSKIEHALLIDEKKDNVINSWNEVIDFLKTVDGSTDLASTLKAINNSINAKPSTAQVGAMISSAIADKPDRSEVVVKPDTVGDEGDYLVMARTGDGIVPVWAKRKLVEFIEDDWGERKNLHGTEWFIDITCLGTENVSVSLYAQKENTKWEQIIADVEIESYREGDPAIDGVRVIVKFGTVPEQNVKAVIIA